MISNSRISSYVIAKYLDVTSCLHARRSAIPRPPFRVLPTTFVFARRAVCHLASVIPRPLFCIRQFASASPRPPVQVRVRQSASASPGPRPPVRVRGRQSGSAFYPHLKKIGFTKNFVIWEGSIASIGTKKDAVFALL